VKIGTVDLDERVLVVAEIGNNHEGSFDTARELIVQAASAGVDAVKFQTFRAEAFVSRSETERLRRLKSFELSYEEFAELARVAHDHAVLFLSTPLDLESASFLEGIVAAFKIASGDIDFYPLLEQVAATRKPLVVSTGGSDLELVAAAVRTIRSVWRGDDPGLALLQCTSSYPAPVEEANLRAMGTLADRFPDCAVGFSDHLEGIDAAALAVAAGARIVEKHFTLDHAFSDFRDHLLSADPSELRELVDRVRTIESLLGDGLKQVEPSEEPGVTAMRRSLAAARDLQAGHIVGADDVTWLRPGDGVRPGQEAALLGRALLRDVSAGELLRDDDVV
jgi:N,N'-diacetyllegionaminate synthase